MFEKIYIKLLDKSQRFIEQDHAKFTVIKKIIQTKLMINRRSSGPSIKKATSFGHSNLWIYLLYSLVLVFFLFQEYHIVQMNLIFGVTFFVWMTAMVSEYIPKLFDERDQLIFEGKPLDKHVMSRAKFFYIFYDMLLLLISFIFMPVLVMLFKKGLLFTSVFLIEIILLFLFSIGLSIMLYAFIFQYLSGEKLNKSISLIQIIFIIAVIVGYQFIIRMYGFIDFTNPYVFEWWHTFLPSIWLSVPFEGIFGSGWQISFVWLIGFMCVASVGLFLWGLKCLPIIEKNLAHRQEAPKNIKPKVTWVEKVSLKWLCHSNQAKSDFRFIYKLSEKDYTFKLKIMPSLGVSLILPFIFLFTLIGFRSSEELINSELYLFIYFINLFIGVIVFYFQFSAQSKAAWIYQVSGGKSKEEMFRAVFKVYFIKYYLPLYFIVSVIYYVLFQHFLIVDSLIVLISAWIQFILVYYLTIQAPFPFAIDEKEAEKEGTLLKSIMTMFLVVPFMSLHFSSTFIIFGKYVYFIILLGAGFVLLKKSKLYKL